MNADYTFVQLKYRLVTPDPHTWFFCTQYPQLARVRWAFRCAKDVMHLSYEKKIQEYYEFLENWLNGKLTDISTIIISRDSIIESFRAATMSINYPVHAVSAAYNAAYSAGSKETYQSINKEKWNLYIQWLVEELAKEN